MIIWLTGNSGSGKTTISKKIKTLYNNWIILDGDGIREITSYDLGLSKNDRIKNNLRIARLAKILHAQKFNIIIASIAPYQHGREIVDTIIDCTWIYLEGGKTGEDYPYEIPECKKFESIEDLCSMIDLCTKGEFIC